MTTTRSSAFAKRMRANLKRSKPNCHICGEAIDYALKWPDPMCFVVDHVNPLKGGGADNRSNVAAAHNLCNSKKRARKIAPVVRRSGSLN